MRFRPGDVVVMAAQRLRNLIESLRPLEFGLPLPVERESLPAHAATHVSSPVAASAKNLHFP